MVYNFGKIEKKWRKKWAESKIFEVKKRNEKKKFYVLDMFPYPSGTGLHIGHAFVFSLGDIYARFKRMHGFNVLYPIGYDSFGLPAENAAIKVGTPPEEYTKKSITNFMKQQKAMGWSYDWSRMIKTSSPDFYRWDQWIFLKMLEKGVAYRKKAPVNWCEKCDTVLANEQVVNGRCWRHDDVDVEVKHLEQWFLKTTDYVEELLSGLDKVEWPERAKTMQRNWIGKSEGYEIEFEIDNKKWPVFTTRPDTLFGVTFMVVSAQHPLLRDLVTSGQKLEVDKFLKKIRGVSAKEITNLEKEGVFTGSYAVNPATGEEVPIWTGNFVVADYGGGMVMAVPAHDQRDFEFAKKYKIPIKQVISGNFDKRAFTGEGELINSGEFDGVDSKKAIGLVGQKFGKVKFNYKLRDWLISRQRYWGTPIPIVYCEQCGIVPVPEKDLPVKLPIDVKFGKGNPLITNEKFLKVKCPHCCGNARRETDTMDTFANSSWYFLRYADPKNSKNIFDSKRVNYWAPIDQYIGGPEHVTMHLIYIRFYTKFLRDLGLLKFDEPALRYFTQGVVKGDDGERMSKSKGNVVEPLEMIEKFGADSLRLYLVSNSSPDKDFDWDDKGIQNSYRFLEKVYEFFENRDFKKISAKVESKLNKTIKEVTSEISDFRHNLAVIKIRTLFDYLSRDGTDKKSAMEFLKLLHVYCPFVTEELWSKLGGEGFISLANWPVANEKKIDEKFERAELMIDKTVEDILNILKIVGERGKSWQKIYIYVLPNELENFDSVEISRRVGKPIQIFAVNDKKKYDPKGKAGKVKPGRPGIFVE